jgi:hypothetical protein
VLLLLAGCVTPARIETRLRELEAKARAERGLGPAEPLPVEVRGELLAQAEAEVTAEANEERRQAAEQAGKTAGGFATGNVVAGLVGLAGLAALGLGAWKKARGGA